MNLSDNAIRSAFEHSAQGKHELRRNPDGTYYSSSTEMAFAAFQEGAQWAAGQLARSPGHTVASAAVPGLTDTPVAGGDAGSCNGINDPLYEDAVKIVQASGKASISLVQRHLRIGYNRAASLIEAMEGTVVSPPADRGIREVLPNTAAQAGQRS